MNVAELETLANRHLDGVATAEELALLSGEIEGNESSRRRYLQLAGLHAALATANDSGAGEDRGVVAPTVPWAGPSRALPWLKLAAMVALLLAVAAVWVKLHPQEAEDVATVRRVVGAQFGEGTSLRAGQALRLGRLALNAGTMEIALRNGVTLVFEGPGELELLTPMRAMLHSGQVVVRVPTNAIGFQLETAGASVVDLGTEFGVKAGPGLSTDVQVYEGVVITMPKSAGAVGSFPERLTAGNAARFSPNESNAAQVLAYAPDRFIRRLPADKPIELEENSSPLFNQTRFEEIAITQPEQPIVVDGDLAEWSNAGSFRAERAETSGQFVEGRMRCDKRFLYIAAHIGDPAPLKNVVNPATDGESGWRGGGLQVRLSTDRALGWPVDANAPNYYRFRRIQPDAAHLANSTSDALVHLTMWHHAQSAQNCLHVAYGMDFHRGVVNPPGYRAACRKDADGRGYTLEYAVPWSLLGAANNPPRPGDTLAVSWTTHWSDEGGRLWRGQLVELRNASEPPRIHTWERAATWGRALYR